MSFDVPEPLLARLSGFVAEQMGLHFPSERWQDLERGVRSAAGAFGDSDVLSCVRRLLSTPLSKKQIEILAAELTVGETYFFREPRSFDILAEEVLPDLVRARRATGRRLRIWSAGCCTGEEPYSIAILLDRILPDLREWNVTILATDINRRFLRKAEEGTFSEWSFRNAPAWLLENYFRRAPGNRVAVLPRIQQHVTFAYLNLAEDVYPSLIGNTNAMDLIFCRNVLIYFSPERSARVIQNFRRSLVENGWLVVSAVETSYPLSSEFDSVPFDGGTFYRKKAEPSFWPISAPAPALPQVEPDIRLDTAAQMLASGRECVAAPPTAEDPMRRARTCANLGELTEARRWVERAIAADKVNPASHYLRAVILLELGIAVEALASLRRTLYLAPDFVLAHFALGNFARGQGRREESERHFANALSLLNGHADDAVLPHSDGLAAGQLREMIRSSLLSGVAA